MIYVYQYVYVYQYLISYLRDGPFLASTACRRICSIYPNDSRVVRFILPRELYLHFLPLRS